MSSPDDSNPYAAPDASDAPVAAITPDGFVACPKCQSADVTRPTFTWWGGLLGPKIIPVANCASCGHSYHGPTGGSTTPGIAAYMVVTGVIALLLFGLVLMM